MSEGEIREPIQKRSIEKKEKIIQYGFDLICKKGYYNTNTAEIAKAAGVSTGIVYQYFRDKHDILIEGIKRYSNYIFFPMLSLPEKEKIDINNIDSIIRDMINSFIENHKLSQSAHEEITSMTHSDKQIASIFQEHEIYITNTVASILLKNGFNDINILERVHICIHLIDDLCHEIVYHNHDEMNYNIMIDIVVDTIKYLLIK